MASLFHSTLGTQSRIVDTCMMVLRRLMRSTSFHSPDVNGAFSVAGLPKEGPDAEANMA